MSAKKDSIDVVIKELDETNVAHIGQCDGEFVVDSRLALHVDDKTVRYEIVPVPRFTKRHEQDHDYATYVDVPDKTAFLAYVCGQIAGQIVLRRNWNGYAYVEDIVVDARFRKRGVGKALIARAKQWAKERNLAGFVLETQDVNVGACRFYASCGFELRGFDTHLYSGLDSGTDEVALYWYLVFEESDLSPVRKAEWTR
jgi:streptothricin acetyltransferase